MTRLGILVVALMLGSSATVGGATWYGRQLPNTIQSFGFELCGNMPCFQGLVPGTALSNQASYLLVHAYHPMENNFWVLITYTEENNRLASVILEDDRRQQLRASPAMREGVIELKDVLLLFGKPCGVTNYYGSDFGILYPNMRADFDIMVSNNGISPESRLIWLEILDPKIVRNVAPIRLCGDLDKGVVPWYGLASIPYYQQHGLNIWQAR